MIKDDFELIDVWMLWQCYEEEIPETEKEMHQYIDGLTTKKKQFTKGNTRTRSRFGTK